MKADKRSASWPFVLLILVIWSVFVSKIASNTMSISSSVEWKYFFQAVASLLFFTTIGWKVKNRIAWGAALIILPAICVIIATEFWGIYIMFIPTISAVAGIALGHQIRLFRKEHSCPSS